MGLRWRLMVIGVAGLSAGLLLGGWLLILALDWAFDHGVDASAATTGSQVAALAAEDQLPELVPVAGVQLVQVVDAQDRVVAGSSGVDLLVPMLTPAELASARDGRHLLLSGDRAGLDSPLRISVVTATAPAGPRDVVVATQVADAGRAMTALRIALLGLFLPLVAVLAAVAWWVIGRTLRPVEALRTGAEHITGGPDGGAAERLPVPAGEDEIHRLAVTLNRMIDRLEAARRRQRQFVADAAHELRSPLAGMRAQLEVARRHPEGIDWFALTGDLLVDAERLGALTEDLLFLAGLDEAAPAPRAPAELVVGDVFAGLLPGYRDARVPVAVRAREADLQATVLADPGEVYRVLRNLLDNAVRHADSAVWLEAGRDAGRVRLGVVDDGPGIPAPDRERVFERFTRLDPSRAGDDGGAGLGLAIVAELLRRAGGSIELADAGPGLRANVYL